MKRLVFVCAFVFALSASAASAATFTFEGLALGNRTSLTTSDSGLTLTLTRVGGLSFALSDTTPGGPPSFLDRSVQNFDFIAPNPYNGNFDAGVTFVSIDFGDFGPSDNDTPVTLQAFSGLDGTGVLLGSVNGNWGPQDSFPNFASLSINSVVPILSIRFTSGGPFATSLFWDNIVTRGEQVIPEPMTLALLGSGLLGLAARRRRKV